MKRIAGVYLPDSDTHFEKHLLAGPRFKGLGTYQYAKIEMALKATKRRRTFVDVGAHVGLWSMVMATEFERVDVFEPMPEHLACLDLNIGSLPNVHIHRVALNDRVGIIAMASVPGNSGNAHVTTAFGTQVRCARLDDFELNDVDLIKIDVEGYERFVLEGALETIRKYHPVIVVEQKPGNAERYGLKRAGAVEFLISEGAMVVWKRSGDYCLTWRM